MKKCIVLILLFMSQLSFSQSADKGKINLYIGGGIDFLNRQGNANINANKNFLSSQNYIALDINVENQISIGVEGLNQNFFNEDTTKLINVKSGLIGLNVKFHFLSLILV